MRSDSKVDVPFLVLTVATGYPEIFGVGYGGVLLDGPFVGRELGGDRLRGKG